MKLFINSIFLLLLLSSFINISYSESTPTPTGTPPVYPPGSIYILSTIYVDSTDGFISWPYCYFGSNPEQINITVGEYKKDKSINITFINSTYFEGYAPLGFSGSQNLLIYNKTNGQVIFFNGGAIRYPENPTETPSATPSPSSIEIFNSVLTVDYNNNGFTHAAGQFGTDPSELNFTVVSKYGQENIINISSIYSYFVEGYAPLNSYYSGFQDIKIYNKSNNQLIYYAQDKIFYPLRQSETSTPSETPTPTSTPSFYLDTIYVQYNNNSIICYGYFGDIPSFYYYQANITVGKPYNQEKSINITRFGSNYIDGRRVDYFEGFAPLGFTGYQDIKIYYHGMIFYYGVDKIYYFSGPSSSSSSSSYETPTPTVTPVPSIKCEYSSNGFFINSTERIECIGRGETYCETNLGSTCSTDSNNSTIKCTTGKSGSSSSFYCFGNNIECTSSFVSCSIKKPQSSYLLVNGVEYKSNYYDHSQQQQQENNNNNNNNNNSSSASIIYTSLSVILLFSISSILIIF